MAPFSRSVVHPSQTPRQQLDTVLNWGSFSIDGLSEFLQRDNARCVHFPHPIIEGRFSNSRLL